MAEVEQRAAERTSVRMEVAVEQPGAERFYPAVNLSTSGIFLASDEPPEVGLRVQVVMPLPPEGRFVRVRGRVVRRSSKQETPGFAVAFDSPDESVASNLHRFVSSRGASG